ncbi:Transcriptional regulator [Bosea sp. LC85]|uniref:IclR family transcriptional regulator n=1 Tax=Bosea sp. LC85 TaxID=1502851 RepID=UPI0004E29814|nr:IclR family transcriptional regulator [Bosea sp. LC85]KFC70116.1 Transcriptional regulator [Bosea sp. LC85]
MQAQNKSASRPEKAGGSAVPAEATRASVDSADQRGSLKSMQKLMAVLDCFSRYDRSLSLAEISERCKMPKTTVHRLVTSLREAKLLEQDKGRDRYRMGIRLFELGSIVLANLDLHREARALVERLGDISGESAHLCVFDGTNMVIIEHREPGGNSVNWTTTLSISPSYCTGVGKAALAFQEPATIEKVIRQGLLPYTPNTLTDPDALRKDLAETRARGYSIDEGEHQPTVRCVAAPIRNASGHVFAAVSVTGPMDRVTRERVPALAELVTATAAQLSRQVGYEPPIATSEVERSK